MVSQSQSLSSRRWEWQNLFALYAKKYWGPFLQMGAFLLGAFLPEAFLLGALLPGAFLPEAFLLGAFLPGAFLLVSLFVVWPKNC